MSNASPRKEDPTTNSAANGAQHPAETAWKGDGVSSSSHGSETAEASADRAEGNTAIRADQVGKTEGTERPSGPKRTPATDADSDENAEEKRQAAVEEHAAASRKTSPHGKL